MNTYYLISKQRKQVNALTHHKQKIKIKRMRLSNLVMGK